MSDQGWKEFLQADGLDDWVVLHGGPTAVFKTATLADGANLALAIAQLPDIDAGHVHVSLVSTALTIRITRDVQIVETEHIAMAREISEIANSLGAVAQRHRVQEVQLAIAAKPDAINLGFWRAVLGYDAMQPDNAIDPLGISSTVWMQGLDEAKPLKHAMHLDVSVAKELAEFRVAAAVSAGGIVVDDSHAPSWWILTDGSGNKVCLVAWPDGAKSAR